AAAAHRVGVRNPPAEVGFEHEAQALHHWREPFESGIESRGLERRLAHAVIETLAPRPERESEPGRSAGHLAESALARQVFAVGRGAALNARDLFLGERQLAGRHADAHLRTLLGRDHVLKRLAVLQIDVVGERDDRKREEKAEGGTEATGADHDEPPRSERRNRNTFPHLGNTRGRGDYVSETIAGPAV